MDQRWSISEPELSNETALSHPTSAAPIEDLATDSSAINVDTAWLIWRERAWLARFTTVGMLLIVVLAFLIPNRYQSTTQLMPPDDRSGSLMAAFLSKASGMDSLPLDMLGAKNSGSLFVGVLRSRTVQDRLIAKFDLRRVYNVSRWYDARRLLAQNTIVNEDRKTGIITVSVTDKDPRRAAAIAQAYVADLDRLMVELSTSGARRERQFLEERLRTVKLEMDAAAKEFSEFSSKNATLDIREQGRAMMQAGATLQGELIAAESTLAGLQQIYSDNNIRVVSLKGKIAELRKQMEKLTGAEAASSDKPENSAADSYPSIRSLPLLGVKYAELYRRLKIQEIVYEELTKQFELAKVQEAKEIPAVKVLDVADVPEKKAFPPRALIVIFGTFLIFCVGAAWIKAADSWRRVDQNDQRKVLIEEIAGTAHRRMPWIRKLQGRFWSGADHVGASMRRLRKKQPQ